MAAGAVVGAVKAAAQSITEKEAKTLKTKRTSSPSTSEVLNEMAPDAAIGAVVGAAQAVMPDGSESGPGKRKGSNSKKSQGGKTRRK